MSFNLIVLTGRLTADVELKTTPNGISVCSFNIAVDRGYGENKATDFIPCVAWRGSAEFISKYFAKGDQIGIEGSLQTRKYQDKNGNNRTAFEAVVSNAHFIGGKKDKDVNIDTDEPTPSFNNNGFVDMGGVENDDLPF